jgi:hypothetical protein
MPSNWIRRRTTVDDLLDDGVENFSDLRDKQEPAAVGETAPNSEAVAAILRARAEDQVAEREAIRVARRRAWNLFDIALGISMIVAGTLAIRFPQQLLVHHARMKYLPNTVEPVDPLRFAFYGGVLVLAGVGLCVFALVRRRGA